ncbi:MAG: RluA family pseudouridine synthase [Anaeromyxobacter sp.]|nr:RluA family pseudouridine synthase [Anaeromyxobacter sp.]
MPPQTITVAPEDAGQRLDRWLVRRLGLPADGVRALCQAGQVRIRGKACSPLRRLYGGEEVAVERPAARPAVALGPALPVLHDDPACLVVDKPADLAVEPAGPRSASVVGAASRLGHFDVAGQALPGLAHRLDRDTTGCLLLARTDAALQALRGAFEAGQVEKRYLALVRGAPPEHGVLDTPYGRRPDDARRFTTLVASPRRARLTFWVARRLRGAALLEVALDTGRTHQIRVQLAEAGFPVLGDATYGVVSPVIGRQALHAERLTFPSPAGGRVVARAPLPADLEAALAALA